ncbi:MAG: Wzz/FepE/Etk N-terminal domain-containing protein [Acidimicrobiales bacterium]
MSSALHREPGLRGLWVAARKRWVLVLGPVLLFAGLASVYSLTAADRYEATAKVRIDQGALVSLRTGLNLGRSSRQLIAEMAVAEHDPVVDLVVAELGEIPEMRVTADFDAEVLLFTASAPSAPEAALNANTWAEAYIQVKKGELVHSVAGAVESGESRLVEISEERELVEAPLVALKDRIGFSSNEQHAAGLQAEYNALADKLQYRLELNTAQAEAMVGTLVKLQEMGEVEAERIAILVQVAVPPTERSNAPGARSVALGLCLGLLVGLGLASEADRRGETVESAVEILEISDLPVSAHSGS